MRFLPWEIRGPFAYDVCSHKTSLLSVIGKKLGKKAAKASLKSIVAHSLGEVNLTAAPGCVPTAEIIICVPLPVGRGNTKSSPKRTRPPPPRKTPRQGRSSARPGCFHFISSKTFLQVFPGAGSLTLHRANGDALHKILLEEGVHNQNGQHAHHGNGHFDACAGHGSRNLRGGGGVHAAL